MPTPRVGRRWWLKKGNLPRENLKRRAENEQAQQKDMLGQLGRSATAALDQRKRWTAIGMRRRTLVQRSCSPMACPVQEASDFGFARRVVCLFCCISRSVCAATVTTVYTAWWELGFLRGSIPREKLNRKVEKDQAQHKEMCGQLRRPASAELDRRKLG